MRKVWGLGERILKDDFRRKTILFRYLVMGIIMGQKFGGGRKGRSKK